MKDNLLDSVRSTVFKQSDSLDGACTKIEGYDFNKGVDYHELLKSMASTGFQASNLGDAIQLVNEMIGGYRMRTRQKNAVKRRETQLTESLSGAKCFLVSHRI